MKNKFLINKADKNIKLIVIIMEYNHHKMGIIRLYHRIRRVKVQLHQVYYHQRVNRCYRYRSHVRQVVNG
jgi:hypothetical protein